MGTEMTPTHQGFPPHDPASFQLGKIHKMMKSSLKSISRRGVDERLTKGCEKGLSSSHSD